jgi:hypothetical protein
MNHQKIMMIVIFGGMILLMLTLTILNWFI